MCGHGGLIQPNPQWQYKSDEETTTEVVEEYELGDLVRRTTTTTVKKSPVDTPYTNGPSISF